MKKAIIVLIVTVFFYQCKGLKKTTNLVDRIDIYLCIGQSNMAGRATIEEQDKDSLTNVVLFTGNQEKFWEKAANPLNKYSTVKKNIKMQRLGPVYSFGKELSRKQPNKKIGLVVNAKGGTSIEEWEPGSLLYNEAIQQTKQALQFGELKGIIWHQGESNSSKPNQYLPKITTLIEALRKEFGKPNLPFVAGQLSPDKPKRKRFNEMLLLLPSSVNNTAVVTTEQTETIDKTHFNSESQRLLGKRYADALLILKKQDR